MPDKNIQMPDGSVVAFPGTMSDDDISAAIQRNSPSGQAVSKAISSVPKPVNPIANAPEESGLETGPLVSSNPAENDTFTHGAGTARALAREGNAALGTITGVPSALYHAVADPATSDERAQYAPMEKALNEAPGTETSGLKRGGLAVQRLLVDPVVNAAQYYKEVAQGKHPDATEQMLNVAPEGLGSAGGQEIAGGMLGKIFGAAKNALPTEPEGNVTANTYSPQGDAIAASLRSNARVDMPAEAALAHDAIKEGLEDRGYKTNDFQDRNGPAVLKNGIDNAIRIQEARAKQVIDPIRNEKVDPQELAQSPDLAARFTDKDGNLRNDLTYGDIDAERVKMNKELRRANFYTKDPSAQIAASDPISSTEDAVKQARDLVYGKAQATTGVDLTPLKLKESALIKLADSANTAANTLSAKGAQFESTPFKTKAAQSVKNIFQAAHNPASAFFSYEKPGLFGNPLEDFNANMQKAFPDLTPQKFTLNQRLVNPVQLPKYNLNLTPPEGSMPPALQQLLHLSGGENVPGEALTLTHPEGKTPAELNLQEPLELEGGETIPARSIPDILGVNAVSKEPLELTPSGEMPADLQRVLPFTKPGLRSPAYPGVKK